MGYNTVIVVYNDTVGFGDDDPDLGKQIHVASSAWTVREYRPLSIYISTRGISYGKVISQENADYSQIVVAGQNSGYRVCDALVVDKVVVNQMSAYLERFGYKVIKMRKKKSRE